MAQQTKEKQAGTMKVLGADGQDMTSKVGRIQIGDLSKALADLSDEDAKALRGAGSMRMPAGKSSKEIIITGGGEDSYTGPDADF